MHRALLAIVLLSACSDAQEPAPAPAPELSGTWRVTQVDNASASHWTRAELEALSEVRVAFRGDTARVSDTCTLHLAPVRPALRPARLVNIAPICGDVDEAHVWRVEFEGCPEREFAPYLALLRPGRMAAFGDGATACLDPG